MVGQQETGRRRVRVLRHVFFQGAELIGVGADVGVHAAQRGPVPAGALRQDGVDRAGRLVVAVQREKRQPAELVQ